MSSSTSPDTQLASSGDTPSLPESLDKFLDQLPQEHLALLQDRLLDRLSPWDQFHLREKLCSSNIAGLCQMEHLPTPVFLYLVEFMQPRDLVRAAQVNHTWRNLFTSNAVLESACSSLFPGLLQSRLQHENSDVGSLFRTACRNFALIKQESFELRKKGLSHLSKDFPSHPGPVQGKARSSAYSHGRLAYPYGRDTRVINLCNKSEKFYRIPHDERKGRCFFSVAAMSKDCVVVISATYGEPDDSDSWNNSRTIWLLNINLEDPERQWKSKILPFRPERCYADSLRVIVTCQNGQVFHWQWGGPLEELSKHHSLQRDLGSSCRYDGKATAAMFHPNGDACYLVHLLNQGEDHEEASRPRLCVVEYAGSSNNSWVPIRINQQDLEVPNTDGKLNTIHVKLLCAKADNNGTFNLAVHSCTEDEGVPPLFDSSTLFNVFTGNFSTLVRGRDADEPTYSSSHDPSWSVWNKGVYRGKVSGTIEVQRPKTHGLKWDTLAVETSKVLERRRPQAKVASRVYVDDEYVVVAFPRCYYAFVRLVE